MLRPRRLWFAIFTVMILITVAAPVLADCTNTYNGSGYDYLCTDNSGPVDGSGGNDNIVNDGTIITYIWSDGYSNNPAQFDTITNNGIVGDGNSDDGVWGGAGNDIITNNGTVYGGDYGAIFGDGTEGIADDDTIYQNGTTYGGVYGDFLAGGDDTIVINGTVNGEVWGDGLGSVYFDDWGNDLIILTNNAVVTDLINGNQGTDTLRFDFSTADEAVYNALFDLINAADPANGSLTFNGNTFDWQNFETLENSIELTVPPTIAIQVSESGGSTAVAEGGSTDTYTLVLASPPSASVVVTVTPDAQCTVNGSTTPITLTFNRTGSSLWSTPQTVTVGAVDDAVIEGNHTCTVSHSAAGAEYTGISIASVMASIGDNDSAGITVSGISGDTSEAGDGATFTIALTYPPSADVTIDLSSDDITEGTVLPASVTFTTSDWNVAQTVTVLGVDDSLIDGDIAYTILTAAAVSSDGNYNGLDPADVSVTNLDNDAAGITVSAISGNTSENGDTATFTIVLNTQPTSDVTINLSSDNPAEGTVSPASLTFNSGDWNIPQTVTVTGVDDAVVDGNVTFNIVTSAAVSADGSYNGLDPSDVSVTNLDNDAAGITVSAISGNTSENGDTATFTIVLNTQPTSDVTINLSSDNPAEGTVSPASLTFTNGNWNIAQTITVTGVDDAAADGNVTFNIVTSAAVSADGSYNGLDPADVSVTNLDNDAAGITVSAISGNTSENGDTATFTIVLNTQPTSDVTINLSSDNPAEGTVSPASLTFTNGNWNIAQTATVTGVDDAVVDGDMAYNIATAAAVSADGSYNGLDPADVSVTNIDNDTVSPVIPAIIVAPTALLLDAAGDTGTYTIQLDSMPSSGSVTIAVSFDDRVLRVNGISTSPLMLIFTDMTPQTIIVEALQDGLPRKRITHTITASDAPEYAGLSVNYVTVRMTPVAAPLELPPPPPAKLCFDMTFETDGVLRSYIPLDRFDVNCRLLVENGNYMTWLGGMLTHSGQIGDQSVLDEGVVQAVDVFSPTGKTRFDGDVVICLRGNGSMIYLNANQAPRIPQEMTAWQTPSFPGFNCVTLYEPGTVVMVQNQTASVSTVSSVPAIIELAECHVTTTDVVRLRAEPNASSEILTTLPFEFSQRATAFTPGWYRVSDEQLVGWVSARYVRTEGGCAG